MFNRHSPGTQYPNHKMTINFSWLGYQADAHMTVRDLYKRKDLGSFRGSFTGGLALPLLAPDVLHLGCNSCQEHATC